MGGRKASANAEAVGRSFGSNAKHCRTVSAAGTESGTSGALLRTLTAITAIFLPLNLIAAVFGMNFDFIPLLHQVAGFWWTISGMLLIACTLGVVFWRKRFLAQL